MSCKKPLSQLTESKNPVRMRSIRLSPTGCNLVSNRHFGKVNADLGVVPLAVPAAGMRPSSESIGLQVVELVLQLDDGG